VRGAWKVAALLGVLGCARVPSTAGTPAPPDVDDPDLVGTNAPVYVSGETMVWEVRWLDLVMGGLGLAVGEPGTADGRPAIVVRLEAHTAGVLELVTDARSEMAVLLDLDSGVPLQIAGNIDDLYSGEVMHEDYEQKDVALEWQPFHLSMPDGVRATETLGGLGLLRGWHARPGSRAHGFAGVRDLRFRMDAVSRGVETVQVAATTHPAVRIDGLATRVSFDLRPDLTDTYPFIVWLSDDERRIPLLIHVQNKWGGVVEIELTQYSAPGLELPR
jgi:hypothetical protein